MSEIIKLKPEELRKLQFIELEMLVEVDRICRKNNIQYSLDGGTLLGAVRHKGFIPWDDDLDIMFLHEEYEKFYQACKKDLDKSRFFLQDHRTDPGYRWGYGKLRRIGTEYIKAGQEHLQQRTGVCIDIFDFESIPDGEKERKKFIHRMFCIRKVLYSALGQFNEKSMVMRMWYKLLYIIPSSLLHKLKSKLTSKYNKVDTENVLCLMWPVKNYPYGFPREFFSSYIDIEFEGITAMSIKKYDAYLTMKYGDYMKLPPLEKRVGVMNAVKYKFDNIEYDDI